MNIRALGAVLFISCALGGCSGKKPAAVSQPAKPPQVVSSHLTSEQDLGLPFFPGSSEKGTSSRVMDTDRDRTVFCDRTTKDGPGKVVDFYLPLLTGGHKSPIGTGFLVEGLLKDRSTVSIQAMPSGPGSTEIGITVHHMKK